MNVLHEDFNVAQALADSKDGAVLKSIKETLEETRTELRKDIDKGLPPEEFKVANNLQQACQAAQDIVEQFWAQPKR